VGQPSVFAAVSVHDVDLVVAVAQALALPGFSNAIVRSKTILLSSGDETGLNSDAALRVVLLLAPVGVHQ
jgi:hypothetical protein